MPRRKILLPFGATFCAIAVAVICLCSPGGAEQLGTAGDEPGKAVSIVEDTSAKEEGSAIERGEKEEKRLGSGVLALSTHRQNYFLPFTYNSNPNRDAYEAAGDNKPGNIEVKFQLSFKVLLWEKIFWDKGDPLA